MEKVSITNAQDLMKFVKANLPFIAILLFLIAVCYANVINGQFISADDEPVILHDVMMRDFGRALNSLLLHDIFFSLFINVFKFNPVPFHLLSISLHMINTVLVFILLYMMFGKKVSAIASILYAVHPVNSEAVSWISAVTYLINGFFAYLTLITFVLFKKTKLKKYLYISAAIFFAGTILAKNAWILAIIPAVFITGEFFMEDGEGLSLKNWKRFWIYTPFLIGIVFFMVTYVAKEFAFRLQNLENLYNVDPTSATPVLNRIPYTIYMMLYLLTTPVRLSIYHEGVIITPQFYLLMVVVTLIYIGGTIFFLVKKNRVAGGIMLFLPTSIFPSFSPILIAWFIAERYLYLGAVFFCVTLAYLLIKLENKYKIKNFAVFSTVVLLTVYSIRTIARTNDFKTNLNIWIATQKAAPYSYRTYNNLGDAYGRNGNYQAAIISYENALKIYPEYADATHNLANTYLQIQDYTKAEELFKKAYELNPRLYQSLYMLGITKYRQGDFLSARDYFVKSLEIYPDNPQGKQALIEINAKIQSSQQAPAAN